jgi:hypothetical protein
MGIYYKSDNEKLLNLCAFIFIFFVFISFYQTKLSIHLTFSEEKRIINQLFFYCRKRTKVSFHPVRNEGFTYNLYLQVSMSNLIIASFLLAILHVCILRGLYIYLIYNSAFYDVSLLFAGLKLRLRAMNYLVLMISPVLCVMIYDLAKTRNVYNVFNGGISKFLYKHYFKSLYKVYLL